jgi:hypothetical protein
MEKQFIYSAGTSCRRQKYIISYKKEKTEQIVDKNIILCYNVFESEGKKDKILNKKIKL